MVVINNRWNEVSVLKLFLGFCEMLCFKKVLKSEKNCLFLFFFDWVNYIWVSLIFLLVFVICNLLEIKVMELG